MGPQTTSRKSSKKDVEKCSMLTKRHSPLFPWEGVARKYGNHMHLNGAPAARAPCIRALCTANWKLTKRHRFRRKRNSHRFKSKRMLKEVCTWKFFSHGGSRFLSLKGFSFPGSLSYLTFCQGYPYIYIRPEMRAWKLRSSDVATFNKKSHKTIFQSPNQSLLYDNL